MRTVEPRRRSIKSFIRKLGSSAAAPLPIPLPSYSKRRLLPASWDQAGAHVPGHTNKMSPATRHFAPAYPLIFLLLPNFTPLTRNVRVVYCDVSVLP